MTVFNSNQTNQNNCVVPTGFNSTNNSNPGSNPGTGSCGWPTYALSQGTKEM